MTPTLTACKPLCRSAHWYAERGLAVFPLVPGTKRPAVEDWEHAATTEHDHICQTWARSAYNIGIATGPSGLLVVDLDQPKTAADVPPAPWDRPGICNGLGVLCALASRAGEPLSATFTVGTPSGGTHLSFTQPPGHQLHNSAGRLGWKIDTRGHGGYVVASGSVVNGHRYRTECGARPAQLPGWITTALTRSPEPTTPATIRTPNDRSAYGHAGPHRLTRQTPGRHRRPPQPHHQQRSLRARPTRPRRDPGRSDRPRRPRLRRRPHRATPHRGRTHHRLRPHRRGTPPTPQLVPRPERLGS
jgi:hypothetical protein